MIIKQIDFKSCIREGLHKGVPVCFIQLPNCKTIRVYNVHEGYKRTRQYADIVQILDSTCSLKYGAIWIYRPSDEDMARLAREYFFSELAIPAILCQAPNDFDRDEDNKPVPEILN